MTDATSLAGRCGAPGAAKNRGQGQDAQDRTVRLIVPAGLAPGAVDLMPIRQGNNPKRRLAPRDSLDSEYLARLAREARYVGSAHHKIKPADYGFTPPVSPRAHKSLCDGKRTVRRDEAETLFFQALSRGMVSRYVNNGFPKYVWAVDQDGEVYTRRRWAAMGGVTTAMLLARTVSETCVDW